MGLPKFLTENRVWDAETIIAASSEQPGFPADNLLDQLRQKTWRSEIGWTISTGFNDAIDFERPPGSGHTAIIAAGTYTTGAALAAAIVTAMEAADSAPTWACDYGVAAANKFRIRDAAGAPSNFNLMFATGLNLSRSAALCLGFTETDKTGAATYTATNVAYQSRQFVKIHRSDGAAIGVGAITLVEHSMVGAGTVKLQGHTSDVWTSPFTHTMTGVNSYDPIGNEVTSTIREYWRLVFNDVQNSNGYVELGIWWLESTLDAPSVHPSIALRNEPGDFSAVSVGIDGTHFVDTHRRQDRWTLVWETLETADTGIFDDLLDVRQVGECWILWWDVSAPNGRGDGLTGITYGYFPQTPTKQYVPASYWTWAFSFFEAL